MRLEVNGDVVMLDVGKLVINAENGEVIFEGGKHQLYYEGVDLSALLTEYRSLAAAKREGEPSSPSLVDRRLE